MPSRESSANSSVSRIAGEGRGALLDVRPQGEFLRGHVPGAAAIPLEELAGRVHELPPPGATISVFETDPQRLLEAMRFLRDRGYCASAAALEPCQLTEHGQSRNHLWQPSPLLVEALAIVGSPAGWAVDIGCGTGRDAVYLAMHGWRVRALDVLPDALGRAGDLANRHGVTIETIQQDIERNPSLPGGPYHLISVFRFLSKGIFSVIDGALAPGGWIVYETFHERTLETRRPPKDRRHVLRTGELPSQFPGYGIALARDEVPRDGRYLSQFIGRKPDQVQ